MAAIPDILQRRTLPEEYCPPHNPKRYLDDEEITIISLLDHNGTISTTQHLSDFMVLLTRLERKVDHRALSLEILTNHLSTPQAKEFVLFGGYRLLKKWLKDAEENDNLYECLAIVRLCRQLPFDSNSIKISEIGKLIKKLSKYQSKTIPYTTIEMNEFLKEVNDLVEQWKEQLAVISKNKQQLQQQQQQQYQQQRKEKEQAVEITFKEEAVALDKREQPVIKKAPIGKPINLQILPSKPAISLLGHENESKDDDDEPMDVVSADDSFPLLSPTGSALSPTSFTSSEDNSSIHSVEGEFNEARDLDEPVIPLQSITSSLPVAKPVNRERKPLDMVEGARKLLAMRSQQVKATAAANSLVPEIKEDFNEVNDAGNTRNKKPLAKGGLKKKDTSNKKDKLSIKWADEEGGLLREIYTIEVEKIKSSVANYKTHKDLVKKERQLEKETHLTKATEAMHRTTEWRVPKPLSLSIQITDNIGVPTASIEKNIQAERISSVLEVRYLDESLIPNDPDDDAGMLEGNDIVPFSILNKGNNENNIIESIPWLIEGQEEEEIPVTPVHSFPSSSSISTSYGINNSVMNSGNYSSGMGGGYDYNNDGIYGLGKQNPSSPFMSDYDINTFINSLPLPLQTLDPFTMQFIIQDPSIVQYLVLADGSTVDENKLLALKNCNNLEEFYGFISSMQGNSGKPRASRWEQTNINSHGVANNNWMNNAVDNNAGFNNSSRNWGPPTNTIISSTFVSHTTRQLDAPSNLNMNNNPVNQWMARNNINLGDDLLGGGSQLMPTSSLSMSSISAPSLSAMSSSGGSRGSSKSEVPCRFFNTSKGCMNGDKCKFGHFADITKVGGSDLSNGNMGMGPGQKSGPGGRLAGPGSMRHHLPGSTANSLSASILSSVMSETASKKGAVGRPSKRSKH